MARFGTKIQKVCAYVLLNGWDILPCPCSCLSNLCSEFKSKYLPSYLDFCQYVYNSTSNYQKTKESHFGWGGITSDLQPSEILNFSFLGNIIGKYIEKYIEICSIHVKISWEIKKTKARPSAAPPRGRPLRGRPLGCCFLYFPWYFYMNGTYFYIFFYIFSYYIS